MREHCAFAKKNADGRCIAICHHNCDVVFEFDCTGLSRAREDALKQHGREYQLGGRFKKDHGIKLHSS
jgi:hypothetical protein